MLGVLIFAGTSTAHNPLPKTIAQVTDTMILTRMRKPKPLCDWILNPAVSPSLTANRTFPSAPADRNTQSSMLTSRSIPSAAGLKGHGCSRAVKGVFSPTVRPRAALIRRRCSGRWKLRSRLQCRHHQLQVKSFFAHPLVVVNERECNC